MIIPIIYTYILESWSSSCSSCNKSVARYFSLSYLIIFLKYIYSWFIVCYCCCSWLATMRRHPRARTTWPQPMARARGPRGRSDTISLAGSSSKRTSRPRPKPFVKPESHDPFHGRHGEPSPRTPFSLQLLASPRPAAWEAGSPTDRPRASREVKPLPCFDSLTVLCRLCCAS